MTATMEDVLRQREEGHPFVRDITFTTLWVWLDRRQWQEPRENVLEEAAHMFAGNSYWENIKRTNTADPEELKDFFDRHLSQIESHLNNYHAEFREEAKELYDKMLQARATLNAGVA